MTTDVAVAATAATMVTVATMAIDAAAKATAVTIWKDATGKKATEMMMT